MTPWERGSLHGSAVVTGASGLIYGWLRYYGQRAGEFGVEPHPLQGLLQHLHLLGAPLLVFALGMVVRGHLLPRYRSGTTTGRNTGLLLGVGLAPMIFSGYAIQVVVEPSTRLLWAWLHGVSSLVFLAAYGVHMALNWGHAADPNPS